LKKKVGNGLQGESSETEQQKLLITPLTGRKIESQIGINHLKPNRRIRGKKGNRDKEGINGQRNYLEKTGGGKSYLSGENMKVN